MQGAILEPPLKGIQILFIICAIMFLTLLLLGLGVSYYCLRRRPIIVRRLPVSMGTGSEITKLSGSSLGKLALIKSKVSYPVNTDFRSENEIRPDYFVKKKYRIL